MDINIITAQSLSHAHLPFLYQPISHSKSSLLTHNSVAFHRFLPLLHGVRIKALKQRSHGAIHATAGAESTSSPDVEERWLLQPVGDGDSRHIGFKVKMPDAYEIVSSEVTVGRLPEKADMVIPVATVSALHARIQKKGGKLLLTDLDSTNGTFIDDQRLRPGAVITVSPGSRITFGDTHLAMFLVSKLERVEATTKPESYSEDKAEADGETGGSETTS